MVKFQIIAPLSLRNAVEAVKESFPKRFGEGGVEIHLKQSGSQEEHSFEILRSDSNRVDIEYTSVNAGLRALGVVTGRLEKAEPIVPWREESPFETLGVMLDVSRNGVLKVDSVKALLRHYALMGVNRLFLYMEDTYKIDSEPIFGYFRGGYTAEKLKEIDDYAYSLSIEVVPFIQTLGHLRQVLQWPAYSNIKDTSDVLMVGSEASERLIEAMLRSATAPFRSKRIHLGMDEAHGVGTGAFRIKNGFVPPFEVLSAHLERVTGLCDQLGLKPMIWSDMFFRLGSKNEDYYDLDAIIPESVASRIPSSIDLVYWDYYHTDTAFYHEWIRRHRALGVEPHFAGGAWTWNRFWCALPKTFGTLTPGMTAARESGVKHAFLTHWGDDGAECSPFSALPGVQYFSDLAYRPDQVEERLAANFKGSCNADVNAWIDASHLDYYPELGDEAVAILNTSKFVLWHDPILGFLDTHFSPALEAHYASLLPRLVSAVEAGEGRLALPLQLCKVVIEKLYLHRSLRPAYLAGDREALCDLRERVLPSVTKEVRTLWEGHRAQWHEENEPFGWESMEVRYGGLLLRLETLGAKLGAYLKARCPIPELSTIPEAVYSEQVLPQIVVNYQRASAPSLGKVIN